MKPLYLLSFGLGCWLLTRSALAQTLQLTSFSPARNAVAVLRTTTVTVGVNQPLSNMPSTQQALKVFSQ
jgi:hypothetical protein